MKLKLAALCTIMATSALAAENQLLINSENLSNNTHISITIGDGASAKTITTQCPTGQSTCNVNLGSYKLPAGFSHIVVKNAMTQKILGSSYIEVFNNSQQDATYYTKLATTLDANNSTKPLIKSNTTKSVTLDKDITTRVNGFLKMVTSVCVSKEGFCSFFNPFAGVITGFFDVYTGAGSGGAAAKMQEILDKISEVSTQIGTLQNSLTDFQDRYKKDQHDMQQTDFDKLIAHLNGQGLIYNNLFTGSTKTLDEYVEKNGFDATIIKLLSSAFNPTNGGMVYDINTISNPSTYTKLVQLLDDIQNQVSRQDRKINYIQLRSYYNLTYTNYYMNTLLAMKEAQEIQRNIILMISSDSKSKYKDKFQSNTIFGGLGISRDNSTAQNLKLLASFYDSKYNEVIKNFPETKLQNIYKDVPNREFVENGKDPINYQELYGISLNYYDGFKLKGNLAQSAFYLGWNANDWELNGEEIKQVIKNASYNILLPNTNHITAGKIPYRSYIPQDNYMNFRVLDAYKWNSREQSRSKAHDNVHDQWIGMKGPISSDYNLALLERGDYSLDKFKGIFEVNKRDNVSKIKLTKGNHERNTQSYATGTFLFQAQPLTKPYVFGIKIKYVNWLKEGSFAWGDYTDAYAEGRLYCVTFNCTEIYPGALKFSDGSILHWRSDNNIYYEPAKK